MDFFVYFIITLFTYFLNFFYICKFSIINEIGMNASRHVFFFILRVECRKDVEKQIIFCI